MTGEDGDGCPLAGEGFQTQPASDAEGGPSHKHLRRLRQGADWLVRSHAATGSRPAPIGEHPVFGHNALFVAEMQSSMHRGP
jgi:hypothetical protein